MYKDVHSAAESLMRRRTKKDIKHFKEILDQLAIPYDKVPCIHVTGTNGKGSTIHYMQRILTSAGYRVGTFTSPYIICHQDRFAINGQMISDADFLYLVNTYDRYFEHYQLSMFEADVLLAFVYFAWQKVDVALIEVGIGGRHDKTNVITPLASVITNIGADHLAQIGPTLTDVAYEKAGIIKYGRPVLIGQMAPEIEAVIAREAALQQAPLTIVRVPPYPPTAFEYAGMTDLCLGEVAHYQVQNACLAIAALQTVFPDVSEADIRSGLMPAFWPGRFEHFCLFGKDVYLDGAHNPSAMEALLAVVESIREKRHVTVFFAALRDKDYQQMAKMIRQKGYTLQLCRFTDERALSIADFAACPADGYVKGIEEAIQMIEKLEGIVIVCGSLHFISQFREKIIQYGD